MFFSVHFVMWDFCVLYCVLLGTLNTGLSIETKVVTSVQHYAHVDIVYSNVTSHNKEHHYTYQLELGEFPPKTVRLRTETPRNFNDTLRITVRYLTGTMSWLLPIKTEKGEEFYDSERTLCLENPNTSLKRTHEVTVLVSTSSQSEIEFDIHLFWVKEFSSTDLNNEKALMISNVSVSSPAFYFVNLQDADYEVLLRVKVISTDGICAIVSVQPYNCPVSDTVDTIRAEGTFQTMLNVGSFIFEKANYPGQGVFIAFVILPDDSLCGNNSVPAPNRTKSFSFHISDSISKKTIMWEVVITVCILAAMGFFAGIATYFYSVYNDKGLASKIQKLEESSQQQTAVTSCESLDMDYVDGRKRNDYVSDLNTKILDSKTNKIFKSMFQKTDLYIWLIMMMGIFYGLPALQLVLSYQQKIWESGNQDLCYFNFLCSVPVNKMMDFNHIFSNIGYMFFGILFIILTWCKKSQYEKIPEKWRHHYGIPQYFGLFFAMGWALVFEGILSACYHVCPTNQNFQFDTTFMYVIAIVCFIKIYQFRHPDVSSNAYKAFFGIGIIMFFEVLGIYYEGTVFWIIFLISYALIVIAVMVVFCNPGQRFGFQIFIFIGRSLIQLCKERPTTCEMTPRTIKMNIFIVCIITANLIFLVCGAVKRPGISSYLLVIFISNLMLYLTYYVLLKLYYKEHIRKYPMIYCMLGLLCWIPGAYFFFMKQKLMARTPAESRNMNEECSLVDFYDNHDIWHFLSSGGLFFNFMFLLTLDDGLFYTPTSQIVAF